jgi:phospholipase C
MLIKALLNIIVYITKENRTYDEVFGQIKEAKGR